MKHTKAMLALNNNFYAPTHLVLLRQSNMAELPFKLRSSACKVANKGKFFDAEFDRERQWLLEKLQSDGAVTAGHQPVVQGEDEGDGEGGIECGCCFSEYPFVCHYICCN